MNIADRIQNLRKVKGISQEELADKIGVSRQAVSKWESEQSVPDLNNVITMSDYFEVTTDYLLKGIESKPQEKERKLDASTFVWCATMLNITAIAASCALWYEYQNALAIAFGFIFLGLGCMVYSIGMNISDSSTKTKARQYFWNINIWLLTFLPLSFVHNILFDKIAAPYPRLAGTFYALPLFWFIYISLCVSVMMITNKKHTK